MTFGIALCAVMVLAVAILPAIAISISIIAKSDAYREDEAQFPDTGDVR